MSLNFNSGKVEKFVEDLKSMQVGAVSVDYVVAELLSCVEADKDAEISVFFETVWKLYPNKRGKSGVTKKAKKDLMKAGLENIKKAIGNYTEQKPSWANWLDGSTFFNGRWRDWVDPETISDKEDHVMYRNRPKNYSERSYSEDYLNSFIGGDL